MSFTWNRKQLKQGRINWRSSIQFSLRNLIIATTFLGMTFGVTVSNPALFANLVAIGFLVMVTAALLGFFVTIARIDYESRLHDSEMGEPGRDVLAVYRTVQKFYWLGWWLFLFFAINAVVFHPRHFGFGRDIILVLQHLGNLSAYLIAVFLIPTMILYIVVRPLYFVFGLTPDLKDSKYLSSMIRFQFIGIGSLAIWVLLFSANW